MHGKISLVISYLRWVLDMSYSYMRWVLYMSYSYMRWDIDMSYSYMRWVTDISSIRCYLRSSREAFKHHMNCLCIRWVLIQCSMDG